MRVKGKHYHTIWTDDANRIFIIDQRPLPHAFKTVELKGLDMFCDCIREMWVRGAPLIGVTAAFGMYSALKEEVSGGDDWKGFLKETAFERLMATRPTAVNLQWALRKQMMLANMHRSYDEALEALYKNAVEIKAEDIAISEGIGEHGLKLIEAIYAETKETVNILTHCNAGWFATIDWGTATAPIYKAHQKGIPVHVWVDETRPRNQGARITLFELMQEGIDCTLICDNTGGHLMQHGMVDCCIVGTDRTTRTGDVANKIGTYLKALAAHDNNIPFYVALPSSTIDWDLRDGFDIPIELRSEEEVLKIYGLNSEGWKGMVDLAPKNAKAANYAFDVTPSKYVSALITERGVCAASENGLLNLFPEKAEIV